MRLIRIAAVLIGAVLSMSTPLGAGASAVSEVVVYGGEGIPLCDDETVVFTGFAHVVSATHADASGGEHSNFHVNLLRVVAVGTSTGSTYHVIEADHVGSNTNGNASTSTTVINAHLVGQGQNANTNVQILTKTTVNADGTVTVAFDEFRVTCR